jgi:hypothetical protein
VLAMEAFEQWRQELARTIAWHAQLDLAEAGH